MKRLSLMLMATMALFIGVADFVRAQMDCPVIVTQALNAIGENCREMARNTACYGYTLVDGTFFEEVPDDYFSSPADRADLLTLVALRTSGLDESRQQWGIALMHVQADVPNLTPGQAVTFIIMGDAQVENRVTPDEAVLPGQPITVSVMRRLQVYEAPSVTSAPVSVIDAGGALPADAIDATGSWVRVLIFDEDGENGIGWIERAAVDSPGLNTLPIVGTGRYTPMQAFYFSTGVGVPRCQQAPDTVTIRSPRDRITTLNVNGADVRIGSTITFRTGANDTAVITVQEGTLELPDGSILEEGETVVAGLDEDETITEFIEIRPATDDELNAGDIAEDALAVYDGELITRVPEENAPTGEVIHIVQAGDTLYSIALQYQASMPAILQRNDLDNPSRIFVGSRLVIPNPGSGYVGLPRTDPPPPRPTTEGEVVVQPPPAGGECGPFVPTSPLSVVSAVSGAFYWDPIAVDVYRLTLVNNETGFRQSHTVNAPQTTITLRTDAQEIGAGQQFSWFVEGLRGGQVVCTTRTVNLTRELPSLQASRACTGYFQANVTWSGAGPNGVLIEVYDDYGLTTTYNFGGASGTQSVMSQYYSTIEQIKVSDGANIVILGECVG